MREAQEKQDWPDGGGMSNSMPCWLVWFEEQNEPHKPANQIHEIDHIDQVNAGCPVSLARIVFPQPERDHVSYSGYNRWLA